MKKILTVRAILFDYQNEDEYRNELVKLYSKWTFNEYHVIVLFQTAGMLNRETLSIYPILTVL